LSKKKVIIFFRECKYNNLKIILYPHILTFAINLEYENTLKVFHINIIEF